MDVWWNSEFSWDGAVLQSSIDGGANWSNVGAFGDPNNWYTDNTLNGAFWAPTDGWSGRFGTGSGGWVTAEHELDGLGGEPAVLLRVAFGADGAVSDDGFAFDNIHVFNKPDVDIAAVQVSGPLVSSCAADSIPISVTLDNVGGLDQSNIPVSVTYSGAINGSISATIADTLAKDSSGTFFIGNIATGGATGNITLVVSANQAGDGKLLMYMVTNC